MNPSKFCLKPRIQKHRVGVVKSTNDGVDVIVKTLNELPDTGINMSTTVVIGNSMTYVKKDI